MPQAYHTVAMAPYQLARKAFCFCCKHTGYLIQPIALTACGCLSLQGVEALLRKLCVRWLVLPSIRSVLAMWRYSFSFIPLTLEEQAALEPHIVSPGAHAEAGSCCLTVSSLLD
jgi:hypothetical protein